MRDCEPAKRASWPAPPRVVAIGTECDTTEFPRKRSRSMRPVPVVVAAGIAALVLAALASATSAGPTARPPLTKAEAARARRHIQSAIELEHVAAHEIGSDPA